MDKTFISYSRQDLNFARRLLNALHNRGVNPWFDMEDLEPGRPWSSDILLGVQFCNNLAFLISPDSAASQPCKEELECALRHEKRIIPLLYRDTSPHLLHPALRELQWIFLRPQDNFDQGIGKLIEVIDSPKGINPLSDRLAAEVEILDEEGSRSLSLQRESYFVGRERVGSPDAGSIVVYDSSRTVSRCHVKLFFESGCWQARDQSRNGIVFFPPCPGGRLTNGTKIFLGSTACLIYKELNPRKLPPPDENPTLGGDELLGC
jgi:hypothetical protein